MMVTPTDDVTRTRLCATIRRHAETLLASRGKRGASVSEIVGAALPDAMTILGSDDVDQMRTILEDLVEEALEGPARAKLPDLPPDASDDEIAAQDEAEASQGAALLAQADLMRLVLDEAERRGLKPGQPVMSVFGPGEVDRLFPGLPRIMQRAPRA